MKKKIWIGAGVVVLIAVFVVANFANKEKLPEVTAGEVIEGELSEIVNASGRLEPKTSVDVSATIMGKITRLAIEDGDWVEEGQFLLEIDPASYRSVVDAYAAGLSRAREELALAVANEDKARLDLERSQRLHSQGLHTEEQLQGAETNLRVYSAQAAAARAAITEAEANLSRARHDLSKVTIISPLTGIVTRLNVEEGENAIIGTMNNPGTLLLTVADLDTMEAEVEVDETEVVRVMVGQAATIDIDAYPDTTFAAVVTEVGNSPIFSSTGIGQQAVDFEVVLRLTDSIENVRPGLSASADIQVAHRESCLSIPIAAMVVREYPPREKAGKGAGRAGRARARRQAKQAEEEAANEAERGDAAADDRGSTAEDGASGAGDDKQEVEREEKEGVFVIGDDGVVEFVPVRVGIAGDERFEVVSGVTAEQSVVTGPFRVLRNLDHGDKIKVASDED